jgi:RHS repeat-associated protein
MGYTENIMERLKFSGKTQKVIFRKVGYTTGTTNSAGSGPVFVRISGDTGFAGETGLYYYGARYLDPRVSRWLSADPAMGEYIPSVPVNDEARRRNGNLPGQGGVFNYVNLHAYHYAGNNPVKYTDPDGRETAFELDIGATDDDKKRAENLAQMIENSNTDAGEMYRSLRDSDKLITLKVKHSGDSSAFPGNDDDLSIKEMLVSAFSGGDAMIYFNPNDSNAESTLAHETGHAYAMVKGFNQWTRRGRETYAMAVENQYRALKQLHLPQRDEYTGRSFAGAGGFVKYKNMPQYNAQKGGYYRKGIFGIGTRTYTLRK